MFTVSNNLQCKVWVEDNTQMVQLTGELTGNSAQQLDRLCKQLLDCHECDSIQLDLSPVTYVTTAGIALLVGALNNLRGQRHLRTVGMAEHHRRLFNAMGLSRLLDVT